MKKKRFVCADTGETFLHYKEYQKYLRSTHWAKIREIKIKEQNGICEKCHKRITPKSKIAIHHLTYDRIGNELLTDLQCLCADCHNSIHGAKPKVKSNAGKYEKWLCLIIKHMNKMNKTDRQRALITLTKKYGGAEWLTNEVLQRR